MGLLIGTGFTLHTMSSVIPFFLMPIAILGSIYILSELFNRYPQHKDRKATLRSVYGELFAPITYTTLTNAVDFAIHFVQRYRKLLRETRAPERTHNCRRVHPGVLNLSRALHRSGRPYGALHDL